ncbi:FAD-binding oxidoreductase [Xylanimonas allomyrinae]|nr:FAD-binding protein [Xylanimonas allomyrinae]
MPSPEAVQSTGSHEARAVEPGRDPASAARVAVTSAQDVVHALRHAASAGLRVTTTPPAGSGTLLLDLSAFDATTVSPADRTVRVGAGVRWNRLVASTAPHGLASLASEDRTRSAVAETLVGAVSPLARTFGLASDHVLCIDIVTPDGAVRAVTPEADPDLFSALRGGAAGLGVATGMILGVVPLDALQAGSWRFSPRPADAVADLLHRWRTWLVGLPESMSTRATVVACADGLALDLWFAHAGPRADGTALLEELREVLPAPAAVTVADVHRRGSRPHPNADAPRVGFVRGALLDALHPDAVDRLAEAVRAAPPGTCAEVRLRGGAMSRRAPVPGCVPGRRAAFSVRAVAAAQADADTLADALDPWATGGTSLDLDDPRDARTARALRVGWGEKAFSLLTALRGRLDPDGVLAAPWEPGPVSS